ncbi:long-chain-acyl-CoA synthetase [Methylocystis bryophila]|uniref:Long-chain-acyl-CoA synthetase n=1 Tax=Methylocystis bryophila TaxID=655015 RepID=A0A1W6N174_9HYPH|nr:long-chain-acyl-CoA synthetase [Methylocystis bryophila]BDV37511.1 long-chain-acyl-CoA synthetase [Methylocystis bryophila]
MAENAVTSRPSKSLLSPASVNRDWLRALQSVAQVDKDPNGTLSRHFDAVADARPHAPALISDQESYTFGQLAERSNRYARWAIDNDLRKGDVVALMMENRAEYVAIWLGLNRAGVVVALLSTSLTGRALEQCLRVSRSRMVIAQASLHPVCVEAAPEGGELPVLSYGAGSACRRLDAELNPYSGAALGASERREISFNDHALYIFTSGTTGLPKAAIVSHRRLLNWALWFRGCIDAKSDDRMYNCLPMFHSVGGIIAIWPVLLAGGSVVIRKRYSSSAFWREVVEFDCSLFQYIGELCRLLTLAPQDSFVEQNRLRLCVGNGLRPDVWRRFQERFNIPKIFEFYASTEGNFSLYNFESEPGSIGRIPSFLSSSHRVAIVEFDFEREEPLRLPTGRCQLCAVGTTGEAIAKIERAADGASNFEGYLDPEASERRILRNVFAEGDSWMRSGDLMRKDARGFFYFVDRIGDTFRWKGENVSTQEVAEVLLGCPNVNDVIVYGVEAPSYEGRAGMAALAVGRDFDLSVLRAIMDEQLPGYARPLFLRLTDRLDFTETFKLKKRSLMEQGFDPSKIDDPLYFVSPGEAACAPIGKELYAKIVDGRVRL